ncbi:MAG TPA: helix-turn-helix domain-containing protein [Cytophagaceae bacterium]|jgi:HTH-type transcriptional regulator/antitoxin HigA|nr:helix-turn-helix domain-containing protein [Cytophagaceae bacterium]
MNDLKYKVSKTKKQYNEYANILEELVFGKAKTKETKAEIELLTLLIEHWDKEHNTLTDIDPVQLLKYLMKENKISQTDLTKILDISKGLVSEILSYKKGMSKEVIRKLAEFFKVSQEGFNRSYPLVSEVTRGHGNEKLMNTKKEFVKA